ncbi:MAG: hypothetical protein DRJ07_19920, partial [Bacteroidetes bacterium]
IGTEKAGGAEENFLQVTPDSTRVYVDEESTGGFAVGKIGAVSGLQNFMYLRKENYFIGHNSGKLTTGLYNLFLGYESGFSNTTGESNTFLGHRTGYSNDVGVNNVFIGKEAGYSNTGSDYNTFIGYQAGYNAHASSYNTAVGYQAGFSVTNWQGGAFLGWEAGKFTTGRQNVFLGATAGRAFTTGDDNVCIGGGAGGSNDSPFVEATGDKNIFIGYQTGYKSGPAAHNVIVGHQTAFGGTYITGSNNVYLGEGAGNQSGSASDNVFIGFNAGLNETASDRLYIANSDTDFPLIYGDFELSRLAFNGSVGINRKAYSNVSLAISPNDLNYGIYVDAGSTTYAAYFNGDAYATGTWNSSDKRWKKNISTLNSSLDKIIKLRGVTFDWNIERYPDKGFDNSIQIGVIAQEVEKVLPELVKTDTDGYKAVAYDKLTAVLIEAVKEQQKQIEELKEKNNTLSAQVSEIDALKAEMNELKAMVKEIAGVTKESKSESAK